MYFYAILMLKPSQYFKPLLVYPTYYLAEVTYGSFALVGIAAASLLAFMA